MKKAILALIVLWAGATWFVSGWTEDELSRQIAQVETMTHSAMRAEITTYEKGWLKSRAVTHWTLEGDEETKLEMVHLISHGPNPMFGWAKITTEPVLSAQTQQGISELWDDSPLTIVTQVSFTGTRKLEINSPAASTQTRGKLKMPGTTGAPEAALIWEGLTGTGELTGKDGWIEINAPGFEISNPAMGKAKLAGLYFKSSGSLEAEGDLWTGNSEMGLGELVVQMPGVITFSMGETVLTGGDKMESNGTLSSYFKSNIGLLQAKAMGETFSINRIRMAINLSNLDRQAADALATGFGGQTGAQAKTTGSRQAADQSGKAFASILKSSPVLEIEEFKVVSALGNLETTGQIRFDGKGFGMRRASSMAESLSRVNFTLNSSVTGDLLEALLTWGNLSAALERQKGPAGVALLAGRMAREDMSGMVINGLLVPSGDGYTLSMSLKNNILFLNGKPADGAMGQFIGKMMSGA